MELDGLPTACAPNRRTQCAAKAFTAASASASFIKGTAPGPEGYYGAGKAPIASQDACTMSLEPGGGVLCAVGVTEQGQGADAVVRQIAATAVGVPIEAA